jgi:NitT/TauT family transport system ATP-binding protein
MEKNIITFENVGKIYEPVHETALKDISFSVKEGSFVCFIGPSGEGKTTILKIIADLEKQTSGEVKKPENISMVFQSAAIFPWLSVSENIEIVLKAKKHPKRDIKKTVEKYLDMLRLTPYADKRPSELSGGQRQRVGIARALSVDPEVLLLDEPFSALDPKTTKELHDDLLKIWRETGKTIVMVSHIIEEAISLANVVFLIKNKTIDKKFDIDMPYPRHEQETEFIKKVNEIRKEFFK